MRRIIGQCSSADFKQLDHLSDLLARGEEVDLTTLTKTQRAAAWVLKYTQNKGISFSLLRVVKEVLIWGEQDRVIGFEFKYFHDLGLASDIARFKSML